MAENKICPHCGGQMFMATITRGCVVEVTTDSNAPYNILKEGKDKYDIEILKCMRCKEDVTEADLVTGIKCQQCGRIVSPTDINQDGVCNVCTAVKERTELANASKEDLIRMLLDAEKKASTVSTKIEKQLEKAKEVEETVSNSTNEEAEVNDTEEKAEKKTRRKVRKKKSDDEVLEANTEEPVIEETSEKLPDTAEEIPSEEVVNDIANQQDAPFPELPELNVQSTESVTEPVTIEFQPNTQEDEQPIGADFQMFDDTEEPF